MSDWLSGRQDLPAITPLGWLRVVARGAVLVPVVYGGLALLLAVRLIERPLFGLDRPVTPWITQAVCRSALVVMGLRLVVRGSPMRGLGPVVANHAGWMDIFVLNAVQRVYFVAKSEVAGWAGIGWLARATGTLFIARKTAQAPAQAAEFATRLRAGHRLLFFPEGTSSDARRVLPFKSSLFAAFFAPDLAPTLQVQPVTVVYQAPEARDPRFYGWWGDMEFAPHLLQVLALSSRGRVAVILHPPVGVADFPDRKALAAYCEAVIRNAHVAAIG